MKDFALKKLRIRPDVVEVEFEQAETLESGAVSVTECSVIRSEFPHVDLIALMDDASIFVSQLVGAELSIRELKTNGKKYTLAGCFEQSEVDAKVKIKVDELPMFASIENEVFLYLFENKVAQLEEL